MAQFFTLVKKNSNNEIDLVTPENKLKFSVTQKNHKEEIELTLAKVSNEKNICTTSHKAKNVEF